MSSIHVDSAGVYDLPAIARGGQELLDQLPWRTETLDVTARVRDLYHVLSTDPSWGLLVTRDEDILTGFVLVNLSHHPMLPSLRNVREAALWVHPRYRHKGYGPALVKAMIKWGRDRGARGYIYGGLRKATSRSSREWVVWRAIPGEKVTHD